MTTGAITDAPGEVQWVTLIRGITTQAISVVETLNRAHWMVSANGIDELIAAAAPGGAVGRSGISKEHAAALQILQQSFAAYLNTPVTIGQNADGSDLQLTPLQILFRQWPLPIT